MHVKIGGEAWQFLHNAVSSGLTHDLTACILSQSDGQSKNKSLCPLWNKSDPNKIILSLTSALKFSSVILEFPLQLPPLKKKHFNTF